MYKYSLTHTYTHIISYIYQEKKNSRTTKLVLFMTAYRMLYLHTFGYAVLCCAVCSCTCTLTRYIHMKAKLLSSAFSALFFFHSRYSFDILPNPFIHFYYIAFVIRQINKNRPHDME